jgi:hypothetical protein
MRVIYTASMAHENIYHLLHFIPATQPWEMPPSLERAARQLVESGRLRINADSERSFVRHSSGDWEATFTARELSDVQLQPRTRALLARNLPPALGPDAVEHLLAQLQRDLIKARGISPEKEMKVARVVVQSAHPAVIALLLASATEIFVSYAHNVGDLMAVHAWQTHGLASGLQATLESGTQVFISCGGDPFFEGEEKTYFTDGFPALARMVVIGAQELGHFADLMREGGHIVGRHSLTPQALAGRRSDMAQIDQLREQALAAGLTKLKRIEDNLAFYDKRLKFTPPWLYWQLRRLVAALVLRQRLARRGIRLHLRTYPATRYATVLGLFLDDMAFNLSPQAEVYRRADAAQEEAIACIEATARVPQQVAKWGHGAVQRGWPSLYALYYGPIIAHCRELIPGFPIGNNINMIQQLTIFMRQLIRKKPGYYPESTAKPRENG